MSSLLRFQKKSNFQTVSSNKVDKHCNNKTYLFCKVLVILFLVGSIFLYLLQINSLATKGFKIQELERQLNELKDNNKKLSLEAVHLSSMAELNEKVHNLDMVSVDEFSYINLGSTGMAKR